MATEYEREILRLREVARVFFGEPRKSKLSYQCAQVVKILKELGIKYITCPWGDVNYVHVRVIVDVKGETLSIQTHPSVAAWAFCETYGLIPKDYKQQDDAIRHATPEDFKRFMQKLINEYL